MARIAAVVSTLLIAACAPTEAELDAIDQRDELAEDVAELGGVRITAPTNAATLSGTISVTATAPSGTYRVAFYLGGKWFASDRTTPWTATIDSSLRPDGEYALTAVARRRDGTRIGRATIRVTLRNHAAASATNPVIAQDFPDPGVLRIIEADGKPSYLLTPTTHNAGDIPVFKSRDLINWERLPQKLFNRPSTPGNSLEINGYHYCSIWAPQVNQLGAQSFMLSFTATRFKTAQTPCPPYAEDSGVYLAWSSSPTGPFADAAHPWEPLPAGAQISNCALRDQLPRSLDVASQDCQGTYCHHIIRLDSDVLKDPKTGRWWLAYSWYTNRPPEVSWEKGNHGEHVNLVELDAADPFAVKCDTQVAQIGVANPHDGATMTRLAQSCSRCGEMLSNTRGRQGEEVYFDSYSWGVTEGASLFRRDDYVYLLVSGSLWDSAYYHVYWVAAPTVEELRYDNPNRLVGRYLVPSGGQSFGHGSAVEGPDGKSWFFVHHRLDQAPCRDSGRCGRDIWVSPIEFEDRGDGRGAVHIKPRFPAEDPSVRVPL